MEDHTYVLSLGLDTEELFFSDSEESEKAEENGTAGEEPEPKQISKAEAAGSLSNASVQQLEHEHVNCCMIGGQTQEVNIGGEDLCFSTTTMQEQERDKNRWGFPQLRKVVYTHDIDMESEGIIEIEKPTSTESFRLSSGKLVGSPCQGKASIPRELKRELSKFHNLANRLRQEGDRVDKGLSKVEALLLQQQDRSRKVRQREFETYKRRCELSKKNEQKLLARIRSLKWIIEKYSPEPAVMYTRQDLENM